VCTMIMLKLCDLAAVVKPVAIVAEKRFKCPLCPSHFSIKKSVLRHLKSGENFEQANRQQ